MAGSFVFSAPNFSAFISNDLLYVTILGDCNNASGGLTVSPLCHKDRRTENYAISCGVELNVAKTRMYCVDQKVIPRVLVMELANYPIAPEAQTLVINYQGEKVRVKIPSKNKN